MWGRTFSMAAAVSVCLLNMAFAAKDFDPYLHTAEAKYQSAKKNHGALNQWVADLPKGGDLHNHFTGASYKPQLLKLYRQDRKQPQFCVDLSTDTIDVDPRCSGSQSESLRDIQKGSEDYQAVIDAWTMKKFNYAQPGFGESHFFATFGKVADLTHDLDYYPQALAILMQQAAKEHINYIEYMMALDSYDAEHSAAQMGKRYLSQFDDKKNISQGEVDRAADLLIRKGLYAQVVLPHIIQPTQAMVSQAKQLLHCDGRGDEPKACQVAVRFQYQLTRVSSPSEVFASMVAGHLAHHYRPDLYVTENLVAPESNDKSIQYYHLQMLMLKYLNHYAVKHYGERMQLAEHAGELTAKDTIASNLQDHIYQAVHIAGSDRIGHGVDIGYELQVHPQLLKQLAQRHTLIEVNLTSNQDILGVCDGKSFCMSASPAMKKYNHPLMTYMSAHVPVALSTDDQGVSDTSLNHEYFMAVSRYPLNYSQIKNIDRNSLFYAFIQGRNLWQDDSYHQLSSACRNDNPYKFAKPSSRCLRFLGNNKKAALQWRLEQQFAQFERAA